MSRDYSDHYDWEGWDEGATDTFPPEPGKEWLTVTEDGEEYAIVVLRTDAPAFATDPRALDRARREREARARRIVRALNALSD